MDKEDKKQEMVVSLRGLHIFTHPALMYGVINSIFEPRFLRRNLSYAASRAGAMYPGNKAPAGRALLVRLGEVQLAGSHLPDLVTLLVVLCEAASTGRDFKPVYAAALTLPASPASCPPEGGPSCGEGPAGDGAGPPGPVVLPLPLPQRQLTRPVLMVLASDGHLDLRALVPPGQSARRLRTDLRTGTKLLGLLADPCAVWAAVQPLSAVLGAAGKTVGGSTASAAAAAMVADPPPAPASLTLRRGLLTRSSCRMAAASGRTLTATLLNLNPSPCLDPDPRTEVGSSDLRKAQAAAGSGGGGQPTGRGPEGPGRHSRVESREEAVMLGESTAAAAPDSFDDDGVEGRATSVAAAHGVTVVVVGGSREQAALQRPVGQTGQVESLAVALTMEVGKAAPTAGLRPRRHRADERSTAIAVPSSAAAVQQPQPSPQPEEDLVLDLEFRYVFDDPSWSFGAAGRATDGQRQPKRGRPGRGRGRSTTGGGAAAGAEEGPRGPPSTMPPAGGEGARGGTGRATWMQDQMMSQQAQQVRQVRQLAFGAHERRVEAAEAAVTGGERKRSAAAGAAAAAAAGSGRRSAAGGGRARGGGQGGRDAVQLAAVADPAAAAAAGPSTTATATERYFVEELRVPAGGAISCPMCPVACRSFRGLQQHLPASHGLYRYSYPTALQHAPGKAGLGKDPGRPSCRHVVEVRLPPESVDPARGDLVLSYEDELMVVEQDGGPVEAFRRPWFYSRAAGMTSCKFTDCAGASPPATPDTAAGADAAAVQAPPAAVPTQPPPQASSQPPSRGRRGLEAAGDGGGGAAAEEGPRALVAPDGADEGLGQQRQKRRRQQQQQPQQEQQPAERPRRQAQQQPPPQQPQQQQPGWQATAAGDAEAADASRAGAAAAAGAVSHGRGGWGGGATRVVQVPVESLRRTIVAGGAAAEPGGGSTAAAAAAAGGAAGGGGPVLPPVALAAGVHPAGRRYFHSRSAVPALAEEMFAPYDSDDETDDDEWEASFDRHLADTTRVTPLRPNERRFFKLWSSFARRRPVFADYITPSRCLEFAREYGGLIRAEPELRSTLVVHLLMLHEMNLVDPRVIWRCLEIADGRVNPTAEEDEHFLATRNTATAGRGAAGGHGRGGGAKGAIASAAAAASTDDYEYDGDRRPPGGGGGSGGAAAADGSADPDGSGDGNESDSSQGDDEGDGNDGVEGRGRCGGGGVRRERNVRHGEGEAEGGGGSGAAGHGGEPSGTARTATAVGGGDGATATVIAAVATAPTGVAAERPGWGHSSITAAVEAAVVEAEVGATVSSGVTPTPGVASTSATAAVAAPPPTPAPIAQGASAAAAVGGSAAASGEPQQPPQQSAVRQTPALTWSLDKKGPFAPPPLPPRPLNGSQPGRGHMGAAAGAAAAGIRPVTVTATVTGAGGGKGPREVGHGRARSAAAGEGAEVGQGPAGAGVGRASEGKENSVLGKPSVC